MNMEDPRHFSYGHHIIGQIYNCHIVIYPHLPNLSLRYFIAVTYSNTQAWPDLMIREVMKGKLLILSITVVSSW